MITSLGELQQSADSNTEQGQGLGPTCCAQELDLSSREGFGHTEQAREGTPVHGQSGVDMGDVRP